MMTHKSLPMLALVALVGCFDEGGTAKKPEAPAAAKKVEVGRNVVLEVQGARRRVLVEAQVCLRQGPLEQFLTRKRTKEHEAILAADVDARDIHTALMLTGAEPGRPVQFRPKYQPATGTPIKITLEYEERGKKVQVPAGQWVRDGKRKKELEQDWVFGGSFLVPDQLDKTKKPYYAANDGDIICVSNFDTAMLDLPVESSKDNSDLYYEAFTERIPPLETRVLVILEPQATKK